MITRIGIVALLFFRNEAFCSIFLNPGIFPVESFTDLLSIFLNRDDQVRSFVHHVYQSFVRSSPAVPFMPTQCKVIISLQEDFRNTFLSRPMALPWH